MPASASASDRLAALRDTHACPICQRGEPRDIVAILKSGWLTMTERAPMRGYACLVFRRHAVELYDLTDDESIEFMHDLRLVSRAVADVTGAMKLNYEIHGNTLPHLHVHIFPRYAADRFSGRPIDPRDVAGPVYQDAEFDALKDQIVQRVAPAA